MDKSKLITTIVAAVLFFVLGGGIVVLYQAPKIEKLEAALSQLSSKTVPSITAYGQVTKIDGKNVSIAYSGSSMTVKITDNAQIYSSDNVAASQQKVAFSNIKVGDNIIIGLKLYSDGKIEGTSVTKLPAPTTSVTK